MRWEEAHREVVASAAVHSLANHLGALVIRLESAHRAALDADAALERLVDLVAKAQSVLAALSKQMRSGRGDQADLWHDLASSLGGARMFVSYMISEAEERTVLDEDDLQRIHQTLDVCADRVRFVRAVDELPVAAVRDVVAVAVQSFDRPLAIDVALAPARALDASVPADLLYAFLDEALMNARKHGRGAVRVVAKPTSDGVRIAVVDAGRGFGQRVLDGAGLTVLRQIAEQLGGRLELSNDPTTVALLLPESAPA